MEDGKISKTQLEEDIQRLKDWLEQQPHMPKNFGEHDTGYIVYF